MDWGKLGKQIASTGADILGEALPFPGSGAAVDAVASAFGVSSDDPNAISKAISQDPEAAAKLKQIEAERETELKRIAAKTERTKMEEGSDRQSEVNKTIRVGYQQGVLWRRAVGWSFALTAVLTALGVIGMGFYAVYANRPEIVKQLPNLVGALQPIFYCFLVVLGVAGYQEGKMGRTMAGEQGGKITKAIQAFRGKE